jgi:predicted metal-dependent enzyme (double-stranded beta helix superfamily)
MVAQQSSMMNRAQTISVFAALRTSHNHRVFSDRARDRFKSGYFIRIVDLVLSEQYSIRRFIDEAADAVRAGKSESELLRQLKPHLEKLLANQSLPPEAFKPRHDRFAMNLLHMLEAKAFSVVGGVWNPGQTTPIHDHLTWALVGVYSGEERECLFRRLDDGSNAKVAKLEMASEKTNKKGHVTVLGSAGIQRVDNISKVPAWSIHVYGRDIGITERHSYDPVTGEIGRFVSGYCNVLRDLDKY